MRNLLCKLGIHKFKVADIQKVSEGFTQKKYEICKCSCGEEITKVYVYHNMAERWMFLGLRDGE